jgi:PAS domain S-box-containing protein
MAPSRASHTGTHFDDSAWSILDQLGVAIAVVDLDTGRMLRVNAEMSALTGYSIEDLLSRTVLDITHPDDAASTRASLGSLSDSPGGRYRTEKRYIKPGGQIVWVQVDVTRLSGDPSGPRLVLGVAEDITARRQAQDALARSQERLGLAQRVGRVGAFDWHIRTGEVVWEPEMEELYGLEPGTFERTFSAWERRIYPDDVERVKAELNAAIARRAPDVQFEFRALRPDGERRWFAARARFEFDETGDPVRMVGINSDMTDRRRAERERDQLLASERLARADAERAGRLKDEFLATLSHELRTPLNAILGWAQVLQRHAADSRVTRGLQVIERNVRVQAQLIDDLLDMSRILSGKVRLSLEPVELGPIVDAALETLRPTAELKDIHIEHVTQRNTSGLVRADPSRLQQIVWNLLSNAIKFTSAGGRVEVRLEAAQGERHIVISDTGCGIDPEFLPHVFERFRQADASSTRRHGGLGLGLAITRHLVDMHGGRVEAHSDGPGQGSTFTVALPVIEAVTAVSGPLPTAGRVAIPMPATLAGMRVLVVDDDPDARELAEHVLRDHGAEVATAGAVGEAIELLHGALPDVLVSDISMPEVDGYELIERVRRLAGPVSRVRAVALTAFARSEDRAKALAAGYDAHLAKPVDSRHLVATIGSLVQAPSRRPRADQV